MKISNRILLSLICLIIALVLPMFQVQAVESDEQNIIESNAGVYAYDSVHFFESSNAYIHMHADFDLQDDQYFYALVIDLPDKPISSYRSLWLYAVSLNNLSSSSTVPGNVVYDSYFIDSASDKKYNEQSFSSNSFKIGYVLDIDPGASISTNLPIFLTLESLESYISSGDSSGWINKDSYGPDITDARFYDPDCYFVNPTMNYTKGTSALSGTLSTFMGIKLNNDFYSYSSRNMKYTFLWDYVNTSFETDLSSSYMHIDIICNDQVYFFSDLDCLSSGNVEITLQDILSFLKDNGVQPVIESFSIRYTPFYKVELKTYYGRSVRFFVKANSSGILQESKGDDLYGSNSDYSDSDIVSPGDLPVKIPGFTDDESFEFDFSYDSDSMFKNFFISLKSLISYCGQIPVLVNKVFSFLPDAYGNMIVIVLAACFIMRLLGR